jgi:uncharacterized membrane protein HdeD (DUF308 family)
MQNKYYLSIGNLWNRIKSESPSFFKLLGRISGALMVLAGTLAGYKSSHSEFMEFLPNYIIGYVFTASAAIAFVSSLTVKNPNENSVK